ncbi:50S ribosomal protein L25 [Candidatus Termititenax persephonae]|uniref:Large ribosomal subunit protein bL25 n=1 Tax=Candidatus Termititenax persephonae TaxID=2218525 RepID=A0A388THL4_9BACT|nr:50S ribosomal protein L25 [Candidatus Termititenax persephonae]
MTKQVALEAQTRDGLGKEKAKKLRTQGLIPAEFYGKGVENLHLTINHKEFEKALKTSDAKYNSLFKLNIQGKNEEIVLLRDYHKDPLTDKFWHLDFYKIDTKHPVSVKVHVKLVGECPAVKAGLVLAQAVHELPVKCLPLEIPVAIEVDISKLENAHDAVRIGDLKLPNIVIELPPGQEIVHAEVPRELKIEEAPAAETAEVPATAQKAAGEGGADAPKAEAGKEAKPEAKKDEPKK